MKIVILGAGGQLGYALACHLSGDIIPLSRRDADLTQEQELRHKLEVLRPSFVINCAGYTHVDRAETEPQAAFAVNALGVQALALACRDLDCTLLHFSTDYVFGLEQERAHPYGEQDLPGPLNVYGASKVAGESFVQSLCPKHFIVRTCGLYGPAIEGVSSSNFVRTILQKRELSLRVVADQVCTPTLTSDLAQAVEDLLASERYGLYHVTNAGACSWHEFAEAIYAVVQQTKKIVPITSREYGAAAQRPHYSVLSNEHWQQQGFRPLRPWRDALADCLHATSADML